MSSCVYGLFNPIVKPLTSLAKLGSPGPYWPGPILGSPTAKVPGLGGDELMLIFGDFYFVRLSALSGS